jgi:hypothetical protein
MECRVKLLAKVSDAGAMMSVADPDAEINKSMCRAKQKEGVRLDDLKVGDELELATKNRTYLVENRGNGEILISGHPKYCPQPTLVKLYGSTAGWTAVSPGFIGRGMYLEFRHPEHGLIRTSRIEEIRVPKQPPQSGVQSLAAAV